MNYVFLLSYLFKYININLKLVVKYESNSTTKGDIQHSKSEYKKKLLFKQFFTVCDYFKASFIKEGKILIHLSI